MLTDFRFEDTSYRLRVEDADAYYCLACERVYGTDCPRCHHSNLGRPLREETDKGHRYAQPFTVSRPVNLTRYDNAFWVEVSCDRCHFPFRVLYGKRTIAFSYGRYEISA